MNAITFCGRFDGIHRIEKYFHLVAKITEFPVHIFHVVEGQFVDADRLDKRTETSYIVVQGNMMIGDNPRPLVEGPDQKAVTLLQIHGAKNDRIVAGD